MLIVNNTKQFYFYLCCLTIYAIISVYLTIHFSRLITGNDAFLYLSIADKYAHGHFYEAVNDYWSPLLSWVLTPFLFFKIDPILSIRLVQFLAGGFTLIAFLKLVSSFKLHAWLKSIASLIAILLITYFSIEETPDLLFTGFILWYFYLINKEWSQSTNKNIYVGVLGALLYFTKAVGFYIVLAHITFCLFYWYLKNKDIWPKILLGYIKVLLSFIIVSGVWIAALSFKYHHLTISDAGKYNFAIVGPKNISLEQINGPYKHPIDNGIYQLPDNYSLNFWERPQVSTVGMQWSPFSSQTSFTFFLQLVKQNLQRLYYDVVFRLFFALWIISLGVYLFIKKKNPFKDFTTLSITALILFCFLPYIGIFVVPRYLLPAEILLLISTCYNLFSINKNYLSAVIISLALIVIVRYSWFNFKINDKSKKDFQFAYNDISKLNKLNIHGSVASLQSGYDAMLKTSLLTYYTQNPYSGQIDADSLIHKKYSSLTSNNVKYLFVWNNSRFNDTLFTNFTALFLDTTSHLRIFDVTQRR